jgi:hypothetical protein
MKYAGRLDADLMNSAHTAPALVKLYQKSINPMPLSAIWEESRRSQRGENEISTRLTMHHQ